jgi:type II restriction/modification system DNA methylase subunit YeeA
MTPDAFIATWQANTRNEQAASKAHFLDLCALFGVPTPQSDPTGTTYAFEKGVKKAAGGGGWADVWKRGCFGWEYKSRGHDLEKAHDQLLRYAGALENPPLLISSDMDRIIVRTNWTNAVSERREFGLEDLRDPSVRALLKTCWTDPERWRPAVTRQMLTEKAAGDFAELARRLRERGHNPQTVAHFVNRLVFCLFADDVGLLPERLLDGLLDYAGKSPANFAPAASELFRAMRDRGGRVGFQAVQWFNGGLFDDDTALPLDSGDITLLTRMAALDWAEIDPSIFGTLFERGLDPDKRSQLGAHYTDRDKIGLLVGAVVVQPLLAEWAEVRATIADAMTKRAAISRQTGEASAAAMVLAEAEAMTVESHRARKTIQRTATTNRAKQTALFAEAQGLYGRFMEHLRAFRVLDPACGSGNFLYLSLLALKDLELRFGIEAETLGLEPGLPMIGPEAVLGIEINPYATELARVSVWIGHIQWARRNGFPPPQDPVLRTLHTIENRDAVLAEDGTPAEWPKADAIVGNPPFLGDKVMIANMGETYTQQLRAAYAGRVPGGADLVCYWFEKAREELAAERVKFVGLVATNSIRGGANRRVLDRIVAENVIYRAWSDEPWSLDGAAVRVSLVCFAPSFDGPVKLDGAEAAAIHADLSAGGADLTTAQQLPENKRVAFSGIQKTGPFELDGETARTMLREPPNPNGRSNQEVVKPWWNGLDVTRRQRDMWIVDFGLVESESAVAFFVQPYAWLARLVKPMRVGKREERTNTCWWLFQWSRPVMRAAIKDLGRFIVSPEVSKHRVFAWATSSICPDKNLIVLARDDDTTFGILHSRFHEAWSLRLGTALEDRPRYTPSTTFETFPFPEGLTPNIPAAAYEHDPRARRIATAACALVEARDRWLNPADLVDIVPEAVPGFPDRIMPKNKDAARILKARTLTALYNRRGTPEGAWLDNLHRALDAAVASAYGWPEDIATDEALARLLAINHTRAKR